MRGGEREGEGPHQERGVNGDGGGELVHEREGGLLRTAQAVQQTRRGDRGRDRSLKDNGARDGKDQWVGGVTGVVVDVRRGDRFRYGRLGRAGVG